MSHSALVPPLCPPGYNVSGRVFVITGGTQGLGLAVARQLKEAGAKGLVLVSRNQDRGETLSKELSSSCCTCHFVAADLSDAQQAQQVIPRAAEKMKDVGPISGLVNAAATTGRGNILTTTAEAFDAQMNLNARAPFLLAQGAAKHMIEHKIRGGIVNICSVAAHGGAPFIMAYSASKAALVNMTKNNAAELAPKGIRVNAVNMGWTYTDNEDKLQRKNTGDDNWVARADQGVPLGRILRPEDVAATVGFLLSDSSGMTTGTIVNLHPEFPEGMLSTLASEDERM